MDQAFLFESMICSPSLVLLFECPENILETRLLQRAVASSRFDDTVDVIRKRFDTFSVVTGEVVGYYEGRGKLRRVDAAGEVGLVYDSVRRALGSLIVFEEGGVVDGEVG